jgi:hypothetical protein
MSLLMLRWMLAGKVKPEKVGRRPLFEGAFEKIG